MFIFAVKVRDCSKICFANDCDDDCISDAEFKFDDDIDIAYVIKIFKWFSTTLFAPSSSLPLKALSII